MFFAYVLQSKKNNRFYYGCTNNLKRRLEEHNGGHTWSTKFIRPLEIVYFEKFETLKEARRRERFFKSGKGREYLKDKRLERSP